MIDIIYNLGYVGLTLVVVAIVIATVETWGGQP